MVHDPTVPIAGAQGALQVQPAPQPLPAPANSTTSGGTGAQHNPTYQDTTAEYIAVRKSDLRELSTFGWLEEGIGGVGMFFLSGAFWLAADLVAEHSDNLFAYKISLGFCAMCLILGGIFIWIAHVHFKLKRQRIDDYFSNH